MTRPREVAHRYYAQWMRNMLIARDHEERNSPLVGRGTMRNFGVIVLIASAAAMLTSGGSASATIRNLGALPASNTLTIGAILSSGPLDEWDFSVLYPANSIVATVFDVNAPTNRNIRAPHVGLFERATLGASSVTTTDALGESESIPPTPIVSGAPELPIWSMMLIGFGLVALQLRRKTRSIAVTA